MSHLRLGSEGVAGHAAWATAVLAVTPLGFGFVLFLLLRIKGDFRYNPAVPPLTGQRSENPRPGDTPRTQGACVTVPTASYAASPGPRLQLRPEHLAGTGEVTQLLRDLHLHSRKRLPMQMQVMSRP